jgi:aminopeptidase-like protein
MSGNKQKTLLYLSVVSFFLLILSVSSQDHPYLLDKVLLNSIQNEVSGERAWDMVSKISRFHRIRGGGDGSDYNRCVEFLAAELKALGLKEVAIKKYKSDGFQRYFLWLSPVGWRVKEAELWMVKPREKLIARFSDQAVSLMPYSQGGEVEAEVIFVGKGKSDADYQGKNVKGKLVFAVGGNGSLVHRQAVLKRGAAGVIVGPSDREDRLQYPDLIELNRLSPTGEERVQTGFGFALSRRQEKELLSLFEAGEKVFMKARVDAELFDGDMPVLEAKIIGKDYPEQEIILMGHLDHYRPGANDNASGSAGLFEMAKNILALTERGDIPPLKRTIRFLWLPEIHGAAAYLTEHQNLKKKGICGMNLDMIGEDYVLCQSNFNLYCSPYSVPGYINDVLINFLGWLEGRGFFSPRGSLHRFNFRVRPYSGGSDHMLFNDSTFSIPTPMLGHGDVFHHTNMDTPDKCDPTEMKRIISLTLSAAVLIANADDEDALKIAREVHSQAHSRMAARSKKSIRIIHQYMSDPKKSKDLAKLRANLLKYPRLQAQVEVANIKKVKELCRDTASQKIIDQLAEDLEYQAEREKTRIDRLSKLFAGHYGVKLEEFRPDEDYKEASRISPKRIFKGPLPWNYMNENLDVESLTWYEKNQSKAGGSYGSKTYEIVNLMDGKRTLLDIRHIVSCEFDETDIEFVLHFARDLEKLGLISFK